MTPEFIAAFVFGCVFVTVLIILAVAIPSPTRPQMFIFRVVLALAAAGVGAVIPGFLEIQGKLLELTLRAGGALAIFVIIYRINPPNLIVSEENVRQPKAPKKIKVPPSLIQGDSNKSDERLG